MFEHFEVRPGFCNYHCGGWCSGEPECASGNGGFNAEEKVCSFLWSLKILRIDFNVGFDIQIGVYQAGDSTWVGWNSFIPSGEMLHVCLLTLEWVFRFQSGPRACVFFRGKRCSFDMPQRLPLDIDKQVVFVDLSANAKRKRNDDICLAT